MASSVEDAVNSFGLKLHKELAKDLENVFFSPLSLSMALSMLLRGARNETAAEINQVLHFEKLKLLEKEIHLNFQKLLSAFKENQMYYTLAIANAIVCQKEFAFASDYKKDLQDIYEALLMEVDFNTDSVSAVRKINEWVKTNTKGKISKIFDSLDSNTVMVLLNSVYFKGDWEHQFDVKKTRDNNFYNKGLQAQSKMIPFMNMSKKFLFAERDTFKVLELPYRNNHIAMLLLLPHEMNGLEELEKSLSCDFLTEIRNELTEVKVDISIPKMHLEYSKQLIPIFKKLGISTLFDCRADLTGLTEVSSFGGDKNLNVSDIIHKAVFDMNEEGCEAAAVTAIAVNLRCLVINPRFEVNHPFLFLMYDKRFNLILFMGRVIEF